MKKKLPEFESEEQEREFWAKEDSTQYVEWATVKRKKFVGLKPSLGATSPRRPVSGLAKERQPPSA